MLHKYKLHLLIGFTLIELLIVLAIVAILITIAYPNYKSYIIRTRRVNAQGVLINLSLALEQYYNMYDTYQGAKLQNLIHEHNKFYKFAILQASDANFTITATPVGNQAQDQQCGTLLLNNLGQRKISGSGNVRQCWA